MCGYFKIFTCIFLFFPILLMGGNKNKAYIKGKIKLDNTWESKIYLSYISSFDDMYFMSSELVIAETKIDSSGYFEFELDFLSKEEKLYRLHIIKRGDSKSSLIIGGNNENHFFLILKNNSNIFFECSPILPPFRKVNFKNSKVNTEIQKIQNLSFIADSIVSVSSAVKRKMVEKKLIEDLHQIASESNNVLIALYSIYKTKFESNYNNYKGFYERFNEKWGNETNMYYYNFSVKIPKNQSSVYFKIIYFVITILFILSIYFSFRKVKKHNRNNLKLNDLSVQERKILVLLKQGSSNQNISDQFNISISTVKSHVSSIYSKLGVKSKKELMNID